MSQDLFYHVSDNDPEVQGKGGNFTKFGLNRGYITKFAYEDTEKGRSIAVCIQPENPEAREILAWIGDLSGRPIYFDNVSVDPSDEKYKNALANHRKEIGAMTTHYLKAMGVTEEQLKAALNPVPQNFEDWAKKITALVPEGVHEKPVDFFMEYQSNIKQGQDKTFLQLPKNMKGGYFISPSRPGNWKEVRNDKGMCYVNDKNELHPFTRNSYYMDSNKANQQKDNISTNESMGAESDDNTTW